MTKYYATKERDSMSLLIFLGIMNIVLPLLAPFQWFGYVFIALGIFSMVFLSVMPRASVSDTELTVTKYFSKTRISRSKIKSVELGEKNAIEIIYDSEFPSESISLAGFSEEDSKSLIARLGTNAGARAR